MSDITTVSRDGTALVGPSLPLQRLLAEYERYEATGELHRFRPDVPMFVRDEAAQRLTKMQERTIPATVDEVMEWLAPIVAAVSQMPDELVMQTRAVAIREACSDLPASAFTTATSLAAVRKFQWFPSAAEVRALLMDETAPERRLQRALRVLATQLGGAAQEPPREPQNVREALAAKLRGVVAEADAAATVAEAGPKPHARINARPLHPEHLVKLRAENPLVVKAREMQAQMAKGQPDGA